MRLVGHGFGFTFAGNGQGARRRRGIRRNSRDRQEERNRAGQKNSDRSQETVSMCFIIGMPSRFDPRNPATPLEARLRHLFLPPAAK
jgi:hypothetical protein